MRPFWEPEMVTSTPHASWSKLHRAQGGHGVDHEKGGMTGSVDGFARTPGISLVTPVDVSLWVMRTALICRDPYRRSRCSSTGGGVDRVSSNPRAERRPRAPRRMPPPPRSRRSDRCRSARPCRRATACSPAPPPTIRFPRPDTRRRVRRPGRPPSTPRESAGPAPRTPAPVIDRGPAHRPQDPVRNVRGSGGAAGSVVRTETSWGGHLG